MYSKIMFYIYILVFLLLASDIKAHTTTPFFRKDYTYLPGPQSFYKIHTLQTTWKNSRTRCAMEGAKFFYPDNAEEVKDVLAFWNEKQPGFHWIYVGISDLVSKGAFETFDGIPVNDIYNKWAPGEPNNNANEEDCVILRKDAQLNDVPCGHNYPYMCKKTLTSLEWNTLCDIHDTAYLYNGEIGKCYKVHLNSMSWVDAYRVCYAEQSYLTVIDSEKEAEHLAELIKDANKLKTQDLNSVVHIGFHNRDKEGWKTVKGNHLEESVYAHWGDGQPKNDNYCGSITFDGNLTSVNCERKALFICEHDIGSLALDDTLSKNVN